MGSAAGRIGGQWWSRRWTLTAGVALAVFAGACTAASAARGPAASRSRNAEDVPAQKGATSLTVLGVTPASGTSISGTAAPQIQLSDQLAPKSPMPSLSPAVPGTWVRRPGNVLAFVPAGAFPPLSAVSLSIPAGPGGLKGKDGSTLAAPASYSWNVQDGSVVRLQQLLAQLDYLPLSWTPADPAPLSPEQQALAAYQPPAGNFAWRWAGAPSELTSAWVPGQSTVMLRGAIMSFERVAGLPVNGATSAALWTDLLQAVESPNPATNPGGYVYTLVSKASPETMTVWHNGSVVVQTPVNTGISDAPTVDGTFPVYEHLSAQVMSGTNPGGSHYSDPVSWVAYFNGGDAVHYISRSTFGYPQSLGCVEAPYSAAQQAWPYLQLGTLVTVTG